MEKKQYLSWNDQYSIIDDFIKTGKYNLALLVYIGFHTGLKYSSYQYLTWKDLIGKDSFSVVISRNKKEMEIIISKELRSFIVKIYNLCGKPEMNSNCFISRKKKVFTIQRVNVILKEQAIRININPQNISTNSLRKAYGQEIYKQFGEKSLYYLKDLFSQPSIYFTQRYLDIKPINICEFCL